MRIDELKGSHKKFGPLYPVLIDNQGVTIDGFHRLRVDPKWPKVRRSDIKTVFDRERLALVSNLLRREITGEEITKRLDKIANLLIEKESLKPGQIAKRIAEEVAMTERWVRKYLSEEFKDETHDGAEQRSSPLSKGIYSYNVWWQMTKREKGYGDPNFHGNTPPAIIKECILKYTKEGETVLDPMAGSGTTIDVALKLKRKCIAFDIKPKRTDIKFADVTNLPLENNSVDFTFAHWPYWNMARYSRHKDDMSNIPLGGFLERSKMAIKEIHRVLKPNKHFALLIGDKRKQQLLDLTKELSSIGSEHFLLFDKIVWIAKDQRSLKRVEKNLNMWRAKTHGYHLQTFDTLLIFRKVSK